MYTYGHTLSLPDALPIFRPRRDELFGLAQHRVDAAADEFSAQIGDDAEGAAVVAAFGNLEVAVMPRGQFQPALGDERSEEHTSELQSLMRTSYAVFCLKKKTLSSLNIETKHT